MHEREIVSDVKNPCKFELNRIARACRAMKLLSGDLLPTRSQRVCKYYSVASMSPKKKKSGWWEAPSLIFDFINAQEKCENFEVHA